MKTNGVLDFPMFHPSMNGVVVNGRPILDGNGQAAVNGHSEVGRKIELSIAYMREHLDRPLRVATLAAQASVSPSHFFALFKRRTGSAPMDYFIHLRMQHACRLLEATSASVKEVAAALGYDDPFYFSRVFKAVNQIPPSRYRAQQKQSPPVLRSRSAPEDGEVTRGNGAASISVPGIVGVKNNRIVHSP